MKVIFWKRSGRITKDDMWNKKNFIVDNALFYALFQDSSNLIDSGVRTLGQVSVVRWVQKEKQRSERIRRKGGMAYSYTCFYHSVYLWSYRCCG